MFDQIMDGPPCAGRRRGEIAVSDLTEAWIRLAGDPVVRRILLIDAPTVLGWRRGADLEEHAGQGPREEVLRDAADAGRVPAGLVDSFAHILLAAGSEMALVIALADDVEAAQATAEAAIDEFLARLLRPAT